MFPYSTQLLPRTAGGVAPLSILYQSLFCTNATLTPSSGSAVAVFDRSGTEATVIDWEGIVRPTKADEVRMPGLRRVENAIATIDVSSASWASVGTVSVASGVSDPDGGANASTLTATAGGTSGRYDDIYGTGLTGRSFVGSVWIRRRTGTPNVYMYSPNRSTVLLTTQLTTTWKRFSTGSTAPYNSTSYRTGLFMTGSSVNDAIDVYFPQVEDVTGQSVTAPSENVSVGVGIGTEEVHPVGSEWQLLTGVTGSATEPKATWDGTQANYSQVYPGNGGDLSLTVGQRYVAVVTITGRTTGTIQINAGTQDSGYTSVSFTHEFVADATWARLQTFGGFDGTVELSIKEANWPAGVDGVKYFANLQNNNTVGANNVVAEIAATAGSTQIDQGVLVETSSTNLTSHTSFADGWVDYGAGITVTQSSTFIAGQETWEMSGAAAAWEGQQVFNITGISATNHAHFFLAEGTNNEARIAIRDNTASVQSQITFDMATGSNTVDSAGAGSISIVETTAVKDGYYVVVKFEPTTPANQFYLRLGPNSATGTDSLLVGPFMWEESAVRTSMIINQTTSAATRNPDNLSYTGVPATNETRAVVDGLSVFVTDWDGVVDSAILGADNSGLICSITAYELGNMPVYSPVWDRLFNESPIVGDSFTGTRSGTTATVTDWEGIVRGAKADEARMPGLRRVENLCNEANFIQSFASSEDLKGWYEIGATLTNMVFSASAASDRIAATAFQINDGDRYEFSVTLSALEIIGSTGLKFYVYDGATLHTAFELFSADNFSGVEKRFSGTVTATNTSSGGQFQIRQATTGSISATIVNVQIEKTTGQANSNPSEYVSVGVGVGTELVTNGTFDTDASSWTAKNSTLSVTAGVLRVTNSTTSTGAAYQTLTTVPGKKYFVSLNFVDRITGVNARISVNDGTNHAYTGSQLAQSITGAPGTYTFTFTAASTQSTLSLIVNNTTIGDWIEYDDVSVKDYGHGVGDVDGVKYFATENTNTVLNNVVDETGGIGGLLTASPNYTGMGQGLLSEPSSQNLLISSEDLNPTDWPILGSATRASGVEVGPLQHQVDAIYCSGVTYSGVQQIGIALAANTKYTYSCFIKENVGTPKTRLNVFSSVNIAYATLQWTGGVPSFYESWAGTGHTLHNTFIEGPFKGGYYKVGFVFEDGTGGTTSFQVHADRSGVAGDGVLVTGVEVKAEDKLTSYIPTTTTAETRNPDIMSYAGIQANNETVAVVDGVEVILANWDGVIDSDLLGADSAGTIDSINIYNTGERPQ